MSDPAGLWVFEWGGLVVFVGLLVWAVLDTLEHRRLSFSALGLIAGTSLWWQEWFGDWGSYLLYNHKFALLPWGSMTWTTPNKPWALIPAYGWYYAFALPGLTWLIARLRHKRPNWGRLTTLVVVTLPLFYAFDVLIEIPATRYGWWSYAHTVGPALHTSRGTFPFLYPLLVVCLYVLVQVWLLDRRDDHGQPRFERAFGVNRVAAGSRRQLARVGVWIAVFNVVYAGVLMAPLVALRLAFGPGSAVVP